MRKRKGLKVERLSLLFIFGIILFFFQSSLLSQTKIMPVGNSITWGKINNQHPPAGSEGYRKPLHDKLTANGISTVFVGDSGSVENRGYFADFARIGWFIHPDSAKGDMSVVLNNYQPDIVILEIGTNNISRGSQMGDYATPGSIIYQLYQLVTKITDNAYVDHLLLCKIIPKLATPGDEAETMIYNNAMENMLNELNTIQRAKVTLVDLWVSFNANQSIYYNLDVDKVHPNATGYGAMANILFSHIQKLLIPSITDEFDRSPRELNGDDGWVATPGIRIVSNGNGAVQFLTTGDLNWDNLAVWNSTKNLTTVSMRVADNATPDDLQYVGLAVGLNAAQTTASGYMIHIRGGLIRVYQIANGIAGGTEIVNYQIAPLQPGDVFKVNYRQAADANYFTFSVNNGNPLTFRDLHKLAGNGADLWSGIIFRGSNTEAYNYPIDYYKVESQLEDASPPGRISDFGVFSTSNSSVTLTWTAVGNDEYVGTAGSYDLRYSTSPIQTDEDFANASIISGLDVPQEAGTPEITTITGLQPGTGYYFIIRAIDNWGNTIQDLNGMSDLVFAITASAGQRIEEFNRPTEPNGSIGDSWLIDLNPSEYEIEYNSVTGQGELANYEDNGAWGKPAVFLGQLNPSVVKLVWGVNATEDGIGKGGLALMLDRPSTSASGYLIWVRIPLQKILMYNIVNGVPTDMIDEVSYDLRDVDGDIRFPQANDTMTVIMDWENPDGHKFDVFMNGAPAASRALYDPYRRHNSNVKYAGIMLSRMDYGNNVTAFITVSEYTGTGAITVLAGDNQSGVVGTTLPNLLQVEVKDQNQTPLPGIPVRFTVVTPSDASVSAPKPPDDHIRLEAEWFILGGTYNEKNDDPGASGGKYIVAPAGAPESGTATFQFYVEKDTTYWFWGRLIAPSFWNSVVSIKVDNLPAWTWNSLKNKYSSDWQWDRVNDYGGNPISMRLSKALHTITIIKRYDNLKIDKLFLSTSSSYIPSGKEYVEELFTDANGRASTALTLGTKVGTNQVKATSIGTVETGLFQAVGFPANPTAMIKNNDGQQGSARTTLPNPLEVTLQDPYGNNTPNKIVTFSVIEGDGLLTGQLKVRADTTDANGKASTYLVLGSSSALNRVQVTFQGYVGLPVIFTATTTSGLVHHINSLVVSTQKHYVNQVLPNFLKVQVFNDQTPPQPMDSIGVTFQVVEGNATVGKDQPKMTNSQGIVQDTLKLGATASAVKVVAKVGAIQTTVVIDSAFYKGEKLDYYSGDKGTASILDTLKSELKVRVKDSSGRGVPNHPVLFKTKEPQDHGFVFLNGLDSVEVLTNSSGIAGTLIQFGPIHGIYKDIVQAWSSDGFNPIPNSPVPFTLYAKSDASRLKKIQGDSLEAVVQEMLPVVLKVQMVDINDEGVPNQPVNWKILGGDGQFEGPLPLQTTTVMTDGNGYSQVGYTLGSEAGSYNNIIQASATDGTAPLFTGLGPKGTDPITFYITAKSSNADTIAAYQTSQQLTGIVGKPLQQPVKVRVMDRLGNTVTNGKVTFTVVAGSGALGGTADTTRTVDIDNAAGIASITWTLGTKAGTLNNLLEAESNDGISELDGSPVRFYATGLPDVVSPTVSTIEATSPVKADGDSTCYVTVTLMDTYGNSVSGKRVRVTVEPHNSVWPPNGQTTLPTDNSGKAYGSIWSTLAGEKTIHGFDVDDNISLETTGTVLFLATDPAKLQIYEGNNQSGNAGTILKDSLVVKVTDLNGNPVPYSPITFSVASGGGQILEKQPVASDGNGLASAHLVLGLNPGENLVKVSTDNLQGSPLYFAATGELEPAVSMFLVSGHPQTGPAGEVLSKPYVVGVRDIDGDAVAGVDIHFEIEIGTGSLVTSPYIKTDMYGYASAYYKMDTQSNATSWVKATHPSLSGSPVRFKATSIAGIPRKIQLDSGNNQNGNVGENIQNPLAVLVTDRLGNPVSGISINFAIVSGDANMNGEQTKTVVSNVSGRASVIVTLGYTTGDVIVEAKNGVLEGSPVVFTLNTDPATAASIQKLAGEYSPGYYKSGDNQKGTVNTLFVDPLRIRVVDSYGNPVPGTQIFFKKDTGLGSIIESQPVFSDSDGIASVHFMGGASPGFSSVSAVVDNVVTFTLQTVLNPNNPVLNKDMIPSSKTVFEGEALTAIPLQASDSDAGDVLTFQIGNVFPPAGTMIEKVSSTQAKFKWTPNYNQRGTYNIILRVIDNKGGKDEKTVTINVLNTNQSPEILTTIPKGIDTTATAGQRVVFWIEADDGDGDPLHYQWKVDNQVKGSDSPIYEYTAGEDFVGIQTVDVLVNDGVISVSRRWHVYVTTAVEITNFIASYHLETMAVWIQWAVVSDESSSGFDVYRSYFEKGDYTKINQDLMLNQSEGTYRFIDQTAEAGYTYYYKLINTDSQGNQKVFGPVMITVPFPDKFALYQNYPNPFNPVTTIRYQLPERDEVVLTIYNMMGQKVVTLVNEEQGPGYFVAEWDGKDELGRDTSTGIYVYQLRSTQQTITHRMVKIR